MCVHVFAHVYMKPSDVFLHHSTPDFIYVLSLYSLMCMVCLHVCVGAHMCIRVHMHMDACIG